MTTDIAPIPFRFVTLTCSHNSASMRVEWKILQDLREFASQRIQDLRKDIDAERGAIDLSSRIDARNKLEYLLGQHESLNKREAALAGIEEMLHAPHTLGQPLRDAVPLEQEMLSQYQLEASANADALRALADGLELNAENNTEIPVHVWDTARRVIVGKSSPYLPRSFQLAVHALIVMANHHRNQLSAAERDTIDRAADELKKVMGFTP